MIRDNTTKPPEGSAKLKWYGPSLLWMLSAVGTGSILFTPRVASVYSYDFLWLLICLCFFMYVMIREMARFSIVSGKTMLDGMTHLPGPKNWAVWLIYLPQLLAASVGIAGLSAVVGSALAYFFPGNTVTYGLVFLLLSTFLVTLGQYKKVEQYSRIMALVLIAVAIVSAVLVKPNLSNLFSGLVPSLPKEPQWYVILPWVGTVLAGSMGIIWFGYWTATRGFAGGLSGAESDDEKEESGNDFEDSVIINEEKKKGYLKEWLTVVSKTALLGVVGGFIVLLAFTILGSELLAPKGLLPGGSEVALELSQLLSEIWGYAGKILMLLAIVIAIGGSIFANQDGWGRSFADIHLILMRGENNRIKKLFQKLGSWIRLDFFQRKKLKRLYVLSITGIAPAIILLVFKDPVQVMSVSGIIAALHTPFIVMISLWVNRRLLPKDLRPGLFSSSAMILSGMFYMVFAVLYFVNG